MQAVSLSLFVFIAVGGLAVVEAELTQDFQDFLEAKYGEGTASKFNRADMTLNSYYGGSFGGKKNSDDPIKRQPVIFVHGVTLRAGVFNGHRTYFMSRGYMEAELYATTYLDGGKTPFYNTNMSCESVKQVREFIMAVREYTNHTVDVVAYSMGVAITRKAILGGRCVDTFEYLGRPLTQMVGTYVAVAGVAYGLERCPPNYNACNNVNGMICNSHYIEEVNSLAMRYEGQTTFGVYSKEDFLVGQNCCGHPCSELKNANLNVVRRHLDHVTVFSTTLDIQYSLVANQTAAGI